MIKNKIYIIFIKYKYYQLLTIGINDINKYTLIKISYIYI